MSSSRVFIFFIVALQTDCSLLSRFKNWNEYATTEPEDLPLEELDDTLYENLVQELPGLRGRLRTATARDVLHEYDDIDAGHGLKAARSSARPVILPFIRTGRRNSTQTAPSAALPARRTFVTRWPRANRTASPGRRFLFGDMFNDIKTFFTRPPAPKLVGRCFACGINSTYRIPVSPLCRDAFESDDRRARSLARYFRAKCFYEKIPVHTYFVTHWHEYQMILPKTFEGHKYERDAGLVRGFYGAYRSGCYKRYLDVGATYTQRGCRRWLPQTGYRRTFATHRFLRLEMTLRKKKDACLSSPHASLTPFNRAVSLYVRYHVCVCNKRYCNGAAPLLALRTSLLLALVHPFL